MLCLSFARSSGVQGVIEARKSIRFELRCNVVSRSVDWVAQVATGHFQHQLTSTFPLLDLRLHYHGGGGRLPSAPGVGYAEARVAPAAACINTRDDRRGLLLS